MTDPRDGTTRNMILWLQAFSDTATGHTALLGTADPKEERCLTS